MVTTGRHKYGMQTGRSILLLLGVSNIHSLFICGSFSVQIIHWVTTVKLSWVKSFFSSKASFNVNSVRWKLAVPAQCSSSSECGEVTTSPKELQTTYGPCHAPFAVVQCFTGSWTGRCPFTPGGYHLVFYMFPGFGTLGADRSRFWGIHRPQSTLMSDNGH